MKYYLFLDDGNLKESKEYNDRLEKMEYINEPLPLKNKEYINVLFESLKDNNNVFLLIYKIEQKQANQIFENKLLFNNENPLEKYDIINSNNKFELLKKKRKIEIELIERGLTSNYINFKPFEESYDDSINIKQNKDCSISDDYFLQLNNIIKLDKQAYYESIIEQLLIYELNFYENQLVLYYKGLDDITKEIICLTHYLNYKESMKQINFLKARLYKTLSESIKNKNFSHMDELLK